MILDPYSTTYGKIVNIGKLKNDLEKYIIGTSLINLNYEFKNNDNTNMIFITGCNIEEKELPPFDSPILIEHRNKINVISDLRKYLVKLEEQPLNVLDVAKDTGNAEFIAIRNIVTADYAAEYIGLYKPYLKNVTSAYSILISHVIDTIIKLNPEERINVELAAAYFYLHSFINPEELKNPDSTDYIPNLLEANLNTIKFSFSLNSKVISNFINKVIDIQYDGTINNLLEYVKRAVGNDKEKLININVVINVLSGLWYGHGGSEVMLISIEHAPTWISLVYTSLSNSNFKRSRLTQILTKYSNKIDVVDFIKRFKLDMDKRHES